MADSKVSLYCYGHGQINGSWVPENFHFCHECDKIVFDKSNLVGLIKLRPTQSDQKQELRADLKADILSYSRPVCLRMDIVFEQVSMRLLSVSLISSKNTWKCMGGPSLRGEGWS